MALAIAISHCCTSFGLAHDTDIKSVVTDTGTGIPYPIFQHVGMDGFAGKANVVTTTWGTDGLFFSRKRYNVPDRRHVTSRAMYLGPFTQYTDAHGRL
jgi:hypothetical protein